MASSVGQILSQKQAQRLALTPQLTQSLKVLAMNSQDLELFIEESLESNPLLEMELPKEVASQEEVVPALKGVEEWQEPDGGDRWDNMYQNNRGFESGSDIEQQWQIEQSLSDSLHEQIAQQPMDDLERQIAHTIIDSLDDDGYFRASIEEVTSALSQKNIKKDKVIEVLECVVQELEPSGIGARDLTECLLLQISDDDSSAMIVRQILLYHADIITDDLALIKAIPCDIEALDAARALLRRLDPFPGHGLRGQDNIYVQPEIIFRTINQKIEVEVPKSGWQNLKVSGQWEGKKWVGKDREFMDAASQEAKWLLSALGQRSETLMKVGLCLAARQRLFLEHGILGLKPLTLQDVAEEVGLHESTISRVTHGKYAQTPLGLIELRRFFSAGLPTRGGGMISVYRVQQRIKILIDSEPAASPISDQAISDRLQAEGIEIARRTVAKYREQLELPSSSQRRRAAKARQMKSRR
ncbi:MAG: RNA polymerase factor sigma-54 [Ghiorsea sp.]|nr:RNA polymerase factor sigma-54 [Ghiorsea sp.]